ncbi:MAG TPA: hypothetical protein VF288_12255 [Mycobacteriales bacterium]
MTLHATVEMGTVGENVDDLRTFLHELQGCPRIQHTQQLRCPRHDAESGSWFYVEADPLAGVARRRCMACGDVTNLLDSAERWTHPQMHACRRCSASLMELAVGLHVDIDEEHDADILGRRVRWLALAARCVECGLIEGLTDVTVPALTIGEVLRAL